MRVRAALVLMAFLVGGCGMRVSDQKLAAARQGQASAARTGTAAGADTGIGAGSATATGTDAGTGSGKDKKDDDHGGGASNSP
ncbi:MAG: hypothetical protein JWO37_1841, partial [Acidimicrobiales bacterium]|nr:hypothetical protein [Acidimicrobiales bacterium]